MFVAIALTVLIAAIFLFRRSYLDYASDLREQPSYLFWLITQLIRCLGRSSEDFCLRPDNLRLTDESGYLHDKDVPHRHQPRPRMLRAVPHRQLNQQAPDDIMHEMDKYMASISIPRYGGQTLHKQVLLRGKSVIEYAGADALFLSNADQTTFDKGEIAHIHSNDGSFHMRLHPNDARLLMKKQWAEVFPMAGMNIFNRIRIPTNYLLVYAPQNEDDVKTWRTILHAAISYARIDRHED